MAGDEHAAAKVDSRRALAYDGQHGFSLGRRDDGAPSRPAIGAPNRRRRVGCGASGAAPRGRRRRGDRPDGAPPQRPLGPEVPALRRRPVRSGQHGAGGRQHCPRAVPRDHRRQRPADVAPRLARRPDPRRLRPALAPVAEPRRSADRSGHHRLPGGLAGLPARPAPARRLASGPGRSAGAAAVPAARATPS